MPDRAESSGRQSPLPIPAGRRGARRAGWSITTHPAGFVFLALIAQIPFELRYTFYGLTNLQWTFFAVVLLSAPDLLSHRKELARDRLIQAAALFVGVQWLAALYAPEFHTNAMKAAARFTAGLLLLAIARLSKSRIIPVWAVASVAAAVYALAAYAGYGFPWLFRNDEFYIGQIQRLSGSFEYPNTAAVYFAMSLPIVWWSSFRPVIRGIGVFFLWCAAALTFSKGAILAAPLVVLAAKPKAAIPFVAIGVAAYALLLPLNPYLPWAFLQIQNPIAVEYTLQWNKLEQQTSVRDIVPVRIRNVGTLVWPSKGWKRFAVAYRWWNPDTETFLDGKPLSAALPRDMAPGESEELQLPVAMPAAPGRYILDIELFSGDFNWVSRIGVVPGLVEADISDSAARRVTQTDLSAIYDRGVTPGSLTASVSRVSLWTAAIKMFLAHPFGVGPDNYRLQYGKYLGAQRWDTKVYSNNLYLELLAGSGILGLAAFGLIIAAKRWTADGPSLAAAVFLVHGLVDVFLMTTPIYFAFWIAAGTERRR